MGFVKMLGVVFLVLLLGMGAALGVKMFTWGSDILALGAFFIVLSAGAVFWFIKTGKRKQSLWLPLCIVTTAVLIGLVAYFSQTNALIMGYKLAVILMGAVAGFFLDKLFFHYAQPMRFIERIEGEPVLYQFRKHLEGDYVELAFWGTVARQLFFILVTMAAMASAL